MTSFSKIRYIKNRSGKSNIQVPLEQLIKHKSLTIGYRQLKALHVTLHITNRNTLLALDNIPIHNIWVVLKAISRDHLEEEEMFASPMDWNKATLKLHQSFSEEKDWLLVINFQALETESLHSRTHALSVITSGHPLLQEYGPSKKIKINVMGDSTLTASLSARRTTTQNWSLVDGPKTVTSVDGIILQGEKPKKRYWQLKVEGYGNCNISLVP